MPTAASQLRSQIRSLKKQLQRCQTQLQKRVSPRDLKKGVVAWQNRRFIQCCQFLSLITDWDLAYLQLSYFCRECRKKLRQGRLKRGMKRLKKIPHPILNEKIKNIANITNYIQWLQEKNLSPNTIRSYLTILAKFPSAITTGNLRNYFLQNINQYDPTSLKVQKYALHSYIKFNKLPIEWEKLARIIPSSQRKFFATINEQDLAQLKQARVEKNPKIHERNNLLLDFLFYGGLRINELVNIKHKDWLGESLRVHGKGNKVRFVLLRDFLIAKIHPYRKGYLFTNQRGHQIKTEYIRWLLKARTQQAQIRKRITPHTFRRSFATLLHNNGAHLTSIQRLLGHTSITTTASYIHNDFDFLRTDYSKLWNKPTTPQTPEIFFSYD